MKKIIIFFMSGICMQASSNLRAQNVGIGISNPQYRLHVVDTSTAFNRNAVFVSLGNAPVTQVSTPGALYANGKTAIGVIGISENQNGIYGITSGTLAGTVGVNTGTGKGIWGVATSTGIAGYFDGGIEGRGLIVVTGASGFGTETPNNRLSVVQPAGSGLAIDSFAAIYGYAATLLSRLKGGVLGTYEESSVGVGVQGLGTNGISNQFANSSFGTGSQHLGVYGSANTAGVEGTSVNGIGVVGYNKNASFAATTGGGNSYGVYGYSTNIGGAAAPTIRYGVYGYATGATTNYAGYFSGNLQVTGSIAKGSGTFKIDHPLDPENKYLYHSFVESPDMMNVYNGNAVTDANGYAGVSLPSYFEAENKDFKYQLTVVDQTQFAQARISSEIAGNRFVIMTDKPNIKISWQVTGVRQDKFANAHRVIPEVEKEKDFKGYYLHAKEWGQPEEKSIDFLTRPKQPGEIKEKVIKDPNVPKPVDTAAAKGTINTVAGVEIKKQ